MRRRLEMLGNDLGVERRIKSRCLRGVECLVRLVYQDSLGEWLVSIFSRLEFRTLSFEYRSCQKTADKSLFCCD
jgi:hypothetical protein